MKQDKLESLVKHSLEGLEPEVPAHLWEGISSRINTGAAPNGQSAPAKGNWSGFAFKAGAAAVIISAAAWWFWPSSDDAGSVSNNTEVAIAVPGDTVSSTERSEQNTTKKESVDFVVQEEGSVKSAAAADDDNSFGQSVEPEVTTVGEVEQAPQGDGDDLTNDLTKRSQDNESLETDQVVHDESDSASQGTASENTFTDNIDETDDSITNEDQEDTPAFAFVEVGILASAVSGEAPLTINFSNVTEAKLYDWNFGNGRKSQVASPKITFERAGDYQVHLTVTDFEGNVMHDVMEISVYEPAEVFIPTSFSPNGDGLNDYFFVEGKNLENLQFKVFRIDGSMVFESNSPGDRWDGKDTQLPEGRNYSVVVTGIKPNGEPLLEAEKLFVRRDQ